MTHFPHDALFKAAFQNPEHAAAEFRAVLPAELVKRIDWGTLTLESGAFVKEELQQRVCDLLFSAKLDGSRALLYAVLEHQSTLDYFVVLRILGYIVEHWESLRSKDPTRKSLPLVLPVVLHHSASGWTGPTRLSELLEPRPETMPEIQGYVPEMRLWLDDISHLDDTKLRARGLAPFPAVTLMLLRDARNSERLQRGIDGWMDELRVVAAAPDDGRAFTQILSYLTDAGKLAEDELYQVAARVGPAAEKIMDSVAEILIQRGRDQGRDEGLKRGREQLLLKQLEFKFGPLDTSARQRVADADGETLDQWGERVLTAGTIQEVFA